MSDNGLDDDTPESDAHDLTEADRTIFGTVSSGDGDVDEVIEFAVNIVEFVSDGHEEAVANKQGPDVTFDCTIVVACADEAIDVEGDIRLLRAAIGYERQRGGEQLIGRTLLSFEDSDRLFELV